MKILKMFSSTSYFSLSLWLKVFSMFSLTFGTLGAHSKNFTRAEKSSSISYQKQDQKRSQKIPFYILGFHAVKRLSPKAKKEYLSSLTKTIILLRQEPKDKISFNTIDFLLSFIQTAHANLKYKCIGGGVPVSGTSSTCGVQSYAGFSCPAGLEICNPLIFGVDRNNQPVCHRTAYTKWCFENTRLGVDHFLDPVFELNNQAQWNELKSHLEEACNNISMIEEEQEKVERACTFVRRQMVHNQEVRNLMTEIHSYKNEDGFLTQSASSNSDAPATEDEIVELVEVKSSEITTTVLPPLPATDDVQTLE